MAGGNASPPIPQAPAVKVKPAKKGMDGPWSGIEEHKATGREIESLAEKLRRLDREE